MPRQAFQNRPHLVDSTSGFMRMDVLSPRDCQEELWLLTYWSDEESFALASQSHFS